MNAVAFDLFTHWSLCSLSFSAALTADVLIRFYAREEHRLGVFENRMLRRMFGPKRGEVTGEWRKLHNEELHDLYSSPNIIRIRKARG
jgi:hypothetical protein